MRNKGKSLVYSGQYHVRRRGQRTVDQKYHPSLGQLETVWVSESIFGAPVWLVASSTSQVVAAGRPIHLLPGDYFEHMASTIITPRAAYQFSCLFRRDINPRKFLTVQDLRHVREFFPRSVGVEVLVTGCAVFFFFFFLKR